MENIPKYNAMKSRVFVLILLYTLKMDWVLLHNTNNSAKVKPQSNNKQNIWSTNEWTVTKKAPNTNELLVITTRNVSG